mgnify:CR=1 FL=1
MALTKVIGSGVEGISNSSNATAITIDSSENVGIGTTAPHTTLEIVTTSSGSVSESLQIRNNATASGTGSKIRMINSTDANSDANSVSITSNRTNGDNFMTFETEDSERMRIDASGNVLVGHTDHSTAVDDGSTGVTMGADGRLTASRSGDVCFLNREGGFGTVIEIREDGTAKGKIRTVSGVNDISIAGQRGTGCGIKLTDNELMPVDKSGNNDDNEHDVGHSSVRWDDIRATNGTIQTSDETEKQDIASLTSAEITAATAISKLFKTYRWKDKVAKKAKIGVTARTHTGVIAQQVQTAMKDAGLDETKYAFWGSDTWWESYEKYTEDGEEITAMHVWKTESEAPTGSTKKTRLSIRYAELMAFIGASTEQRLASIEARLTALEAK